MCVCEGGGGPLGLVGHFGLGTSGHLCRVWVVGELRELQS